MSDDELIEYRGLLESPNPSYKPWYNTQVDFNTNGLSYYEYLAKLNHFISLLTARCNELWLAKKDNDVNIATIQNKLLKLQKQIADLPIEEMETKATQIEQTLIALQNLVATIESDNLNVTTANSNGYFLLPVYNTADDYQVTHPSTLYFEEGFNGYKWWLAATPYLLSNEWLENPSIFCSNDGVNWTIPRDGVNPLVITNDAQNMHYSDNHLIYVNGRLECWFRQSFRGNNPYKEVIQRKTSLDGKTWGETETLYTRDGTIKELLCPVINFNNGVYQIWVVNASKNVFEYFESETGSNWKKIRDINFPVHPLHDYIKPWHIDIKVNAEGIYECYYSGGKDDIGEVMCYATSDDNITYTWQADVMENRPNNFDSYRIYRPAILDIGDTRYLFYGGSDKIGNWYIGLTTAFVKQPTKFYGATLFKKTGKTNKINIGQFSHVSETEVKLVFPGVSDVRLKTTADYPGVWQVKEGIGNGEAFGKTLVYQYIFWDTGVDDARKYLMVKNGQLIFFDGNYEQRLGILYTGHSNGRPQAPFLGSQYFDTQLGYPVWWNGNTWVDAKGIIA